MKILVLTDTYPSESDPVACVFIKEQIEILEKKHDLRVLVIGRRFVSIMDLIEYPGGRFPYINVDGQMEGRKNGEGEKKIFRIEYPVFTFFRKPIHILNGISIYLNVLKTMNKIGFKPDLIYAHKSFPSGYAGWKLKKRFDVPVVTMEFQGPFSSYFDEPYRGKRVIDTINHINRTIYTALQQREIHARGGKKERLGFAHFGVDTDRFTFSKESHRYREEEIRKGKFKLLVVGRIEEAKGIGYIIEAIEILRQEFPSVCLTIAGPVGKGGEKILAGIKTANLDGNIHYEGICANETLPSLIREHDILVSASMYETFGITLVEAMACGKPVVATKCGGPEQTVNASVGVLVEKADTRALAEGIRYVIKNYDRYDPEEIRKYAVQNYSQEVAVNRLEEIFEEVLRGNELCAG